MPLTLPLIHQLQKMTVVPATDMPMYADIAQTINTLLTGEPTAISSIRGSRFFPAISGTALFYPFSVGTLVVVHVIGLPHHNTDYGKTFYGFHIHEGKHCTGNETDPFADTGAHYNPTACLHPHHAGDLPPLLGNNGEALTIFYIDSFLPDQIIGHTLVIHEMPDDLMTQPSGNSGMKIACGEISFPPIYRPVSPSP